MKFIIAICLFLLSSSAFSQAYQFPDVKGSKKIRKVNIYDGDKLLKKCAPMVMSYRFAAGDKIDVSLKSKKMKKIKSFTIYLFPDFEKYSVSDFKEDIDYSFVVPNTGVYKFVVVGGNCVCSKRTLRIKIDRQAVSDSLTNFNTNVAFQEVTDSIVSYVSEQFLIKSDSSIVQISDSEVKISSQNALNGNSNRSVKSFELPKDVKMWSYYIGVGQPAAKGYDDAIHKNLNTTATSLSALNPWYSLMVLGIDKFVKINAGENIKYVISSATNVGEQFLRIGFYPMGDASLLKQGDVISDESRMTRPTQGKVSFLLTNDNVMFPIQLRLVVTCLVVHQEFETRRVRKVNYQQRLIPID